MDNFIKLSMESSDTDKDKEYCSVCKVWIRYGYVIGKDTNNYESYEPIAHCPDCHRIWDGNAQCPCFISLKY
jgi:hypothetical protein